MMKKLQPFILVIMLTLMYVYPMRAQEVKEESMTAETDISTMTSEDYINLKLPPLSILYENARSTPSIELLARQKQLQEKLLSKEKRAWLSFVSARAGYNYGKTDNYGSLSDVGTPIFYQYTGVAQHYYNVGGNINIPLETLFDLGGKTRRQKINVEMAELQKQETFNQLKIVISQLYVQILSMISNLKSASESVTLAKARYQLDEENFRNGGINPDILAGSKKLEVEALRIYEEFHASLNQSLFQLEILSNTSIISKK